MLRLLNPNDVPDARTIAYLKTTHSGTSVSVEAVDTLLKMLEQWDKKTKFIGYFEGETLISWMAVRFGTLGEEKVWVILNLFTSRFHNYFSWAHPELGKLVAWAFQEAEDNGYFAYLYSVATRLERVYEMQWRKNPWLPPQGRYEKEVVARVPANTEHELAWLNRLAHLPKPDDISVLKRTLKKEY
jgi:hypothetical protein